MKLYRFLLGSLLFLLCSARLCFADGYSNPDPWYADHIDIQGARFVSEDGYFFFELCNVSNDTLFIEVHFDSRFKFLDDITTKRGEGGGTSQEAYQNYIFNLTLQSNTIKKLHFVAPSIDNTQEYHDFYFWFDFPHETSGDYRINYRVIVLDMWTVQSWTIGDKHGTTWNDLWNDRNELSVELLRLKGEKNLLEKELTTKTFLINTGYLLIFWIFCSSIAAITLAISFIRKWRHKQ